MTITVPDASPPASTSVLVDPGKPNPGQLLRNTTRSGRTTLLLVAPSVAVFIIGLLLPLGFFAVFSFWRVENFEIVPSWTMQNYADAVGDPSFRRLLGNTLLIAGVAGISTTVLAVVLSTILRFVLPQWQNRVLLLVMIALFSGYLVRIFAWQTLLGGNGIINQTLLQLGVINTPISALLYTKWSAVIVLTSFALPIALIPCNAGFQNVNLNEVRAARDLGASVFVAFRRIVLPLSWPAIFAAFSLSFLVSSGDYLTPTLVGGSSGTMVGPLIAATFLNNFDWPHGASLGVLYLIAVLAALGLAHLVGRMVVR
jgi:spermidine/putrescine transport system permease protein